MMKEAVDIELTYSRKLANRAPIIGMNENIITDAVHNLANKKLKAIGLEPIFPNSPETILEKLVTKNINDINDGKVNFFEANVTNYSKSSVNMDDF